MPNPRRGIKYCVQSLNEHSETGGAGCAEAGGAGCAEAGGADCAEAGGAGCAGKVVIG